MASAGSITPTPPPSIRKRKAYFLKKGEYTGLHLPILILLTIVFIISQVSALRTHSAGKGRSTGNGDHHHVTRSRSSSSSSAIFHPPAAKERRLSFLNHQLSILGGKVGPETRISSKIYSHRVDGTVGTDEISVVDVPQNSDVVVGKEIPKGTRLLLECQAEFPVTWVYKGDGVRTTIEFLVK